MKNHNVLTWIKIIICTLVFFCIPAGCMMLNSFEQSRTVAMTLTLNTAALIMIGLNHQLAALHVRRFASNLKENLIYVVFSALFVWAIGYLSGRFFSFQTEVIDPEILSSYPFFAPTILIAYTLSYAFCFNTVFKLMTDKLHPHTEPQIVILISGLLFGMTITLSQFALIPLLKGTFDVMIFLKGFVVNFLLSLCCSYCYNQTRSIVSMTLGMSLASLILVLL